MSDLLGSLPSTSCARRRGESRLVAATATAIRHNRNFMGGEYHPRFDLKSLQVFRTILRREGAPDPTRSLEPASGRSLGREQIVTARAGNFAPDEFTHGRGSAEDDSGVDVGRISFAAREVRLVDEQF